MDTKTLLGIGLNDWIRLIAVIGAVATMITGLFFVFRRLEALEQGFGPNSLRAIGIILFLPTLLIIPLISPQFQTETLSALLGTVAGYVLSKSADKDDKKPPVI